MTPEEWKPLPGYEHYEVSNLGRVRKTSFLSVHMTSGGYPQFQVFESDGSKRRKKGAKKNIGKKILLHRAMAELFIPNPDSLPVVNHKDGNKGNFNLSNLEWCTYSHNMKHAYQTGLNKGGKSQINRIVLQTDKSGKPVKVWRGIKEIESCGMTWNKVYDSIKRGVLYRGYKWFYTGLMYDYRTDTTFKKEGSEKIYRDFPTAEEYEQFIKKNV